MSPMADQLPDIAEVEEAFAFLEDWEDSILGNASDNLEKVKTIFNCKNTHVISPSNTPINVEDLQQDYQQSSLKSFGQALNIKFRVLKRAVGVFFSTN